MSKTPNTLVLDLDGTLVDSVPDLAASLNRLLASRRLTPFSPAEVAAMIGDGAAALLRRALSARGHEAGPADTAAFLDDYGRHAADASRPFPGVVATLDHLRDHGWRLAVCTNKPEAAARALLGTLGLAPFFAAIVGGDTLAHRKPDPRHLLATIAAADGDPATAIMVGDHANDIQAARAAEIPAIFALWGYGPPAMADGAAAQAARFTDLPALAAQLLP